MFHIGNPDHAKLYPQRLFDWIHAETQIRHVINAEMIAGLGILITEALGTAQAPIVASQVADLVRFRETCRAFTIAAEETGFISPGGLYKPNNIFVDFGRAYYLENVHKMIETLIDFCGRGVVVYPTKADLDNPNSAERCAARCVATTQRRRPDEDLSHDPRAASPSGEPGTPCSRNSTARRSG